MKGRIEEWILLSILFYCVLYYRALIDSPHYHFVTKRSVYLE